MAEKTEMRRLMHRLTAIELSKMAGELAAAVTALELVEAEKKRVNEALKERTDMHKLHIKELAAKITTGQEERLIYCTVYRAFEQNEIRVYRSDTEELIETRAMTPAERQKDLIPDEPQTSH